MAKSKAALKVSSKTIDPTLDALFSSSSGPVKAPSTTRYAELLPVKEKKPIPPRDIQVEEDSGHDDGSDAAEEDDESLSEIEGADLDDFDEESEEDDSEDDKLEDEESGSEEVTPVVSKKERKRKRKDEHDDLEAKYMQKLAEEEEEEQDSRSEKRRKGEAGQVINGATSEEGERVEESEDDGPIVHESLIQKTEEYGDVELEKANRTLFLGNISIEAVTSSKAKKALLAHISEPLASIDSSTEPQRVETLRFRSTPFSTGSMPKRAAYITKSVMSATTKSTNAYAVYSTPLAARTALKALNGTVILDRHLRADSVAHPTPIDHRRCVFVGNLGFVDDETVLNINAEGETQTKKRTKVPADIEEGLWRTFGTSAGKVESVRVPRDPKTRVGKGFAYVQFYDGNSVEGALLLDGKKFPPMLPRPLRVSRAKDPRKTALATERTRKTRLEASGGVDGKGKSTKYKPKATPEQQSLAGRAGRLLGRAAVARQKHGVSGGPGKPRVQAEHANGREMKTPEQVVFEGRRASAKDGRPKDLKFGKTKGKKAAVKPKTRGAKRAAEWRKKGVK